MTAALLPFLRDLYGSHVTGYYGRDNTFNRGSVTDKVLLGHLEGRYRVGTYFDPGDGTVILGVIDLDNKENPDGEKPHARRAAEALLGLGLSAEIFTSKGKGYHIPVYFAEPVAAWAVRKVLTYAAEKAGRPDAEIFPKQDKVDVYIPPVGSKESARVGSYINLPFHGADLPRGRTALLNKANGMDPYPDQAEAAGGIKKNSAEDLTGALAMIGEDATPPARKPAATVEDKRPIERLAAVFEKCAELDGMRRNAIEAGRLLPENKSGEHLARIRMMNLYRAFEGGPEQAVREIFSHLDDFNPRETEKHLASLRGAPPPCAELCPAGQCEAIKARGGKSPFAFAFESRTERKAAPATTPAEALEGFRPTDLWNARLFVHLHGDKVRYCERLGGWHYYDGKRWARETCGEVERLTKDLPPFMYRMAAAEPDTAKRQAIAKHAARTEAVGKLAAILELAKTEEGIAVPPGAFDAQPWLFNVANGTLDLITGELLPHRPEDMLTNLSPAEWRGLDAKGERFERFLHEAMDGDQEKIDFLQLAAGFTLSGDMREQVFFFGHGPEAAGKGTFIRALADVMGTYARSTEISTFLTARRDAVRNDVASLVGSRLVTASEPEDGQVFDEGLIKILTGQDRTTARFLFREAFEFSATFKLWLQGNHRPHIKSTGGAMWRRLLIVPFTQTIPEDRRDKTLGDRLRTPEERAGILAWAVRGCLEWQRGGLRPPDSVRAAVAAYRAAEDRLAPFLEECTAASEHGQVPAGKLYAEYKAWAEVNGERAMSKRAFGMRLEEKGYRQTRTTKTRAWDGLFLVDRAAGG